jgi:alkylhydroperoxidase family enzyme
MDLPPKPRNSKITVPLPDEAALPSVVRARLEVLPPLDNLRMFANVPECFLAVTGLINALFHEGKIEPKLREYMYLRIAAKYGLLYEYRHNLLFAEQLGMDAADITAVTSDGPVEGLGDDGDLVCKAAEEITANISISDETLKALLDRFGTEGACEIILLGSTC